VELVPIYGGSFNPPGLHHRLIAEAVASFFGRLTIIPCGFRKDKPDALAVSRMDRKDLVALNFAGIPGVEICYDDLDDDVFTPTWKLDEKYSNKGRVWHVVGPDLLEGGRRGESEIHRSWQEGDYLWSNLNFAVIVPENCSIADGDLPPNNLIVRTGPLYGRSRLIRQAIAQGGSLKSLLLPAVAQTIRDRRLYNYKKRQLQLGGAA
jgi:NAD+ kinase